MRITADQVRRAAHAPTQAAAEDCLGDAAGWMLAESPPPAPPAAIGSALVLLAWSTPPGGRILDGFALPVLWQEGAYHDPGLPPALVAVADDVSQTIRPGTPWVLARHPCLQRCDLSELSCGAESAWVALATGLVLAMGGLRPNPQVGLTGAWLPALGLIPITHLATKAQVVRRLGMSRLFAPAATLGAIPDGLTLGTLPTGIKDWRTSLGPVLQALAVPPAPDSGLAARWAFADLQGDQKNQYLITSGTAVAQGRQLACDVRPVGTLVALLSSSAAVVTATALRAQRVILVHTRRDEDLAILASHALGAERRQVGRDDDAALARLVQQLRPDVLDLQGGTKRMALVAALAAPDAGIVVLDGVHDGPTHRSGGERLVWVRRPQADATPLVTAAAEPTVPIATNPVCQAAPAVTEYQAMAAPPIPHHRCTFTITLPRGGHLPTWKGSLLRGVIGHGVRAVAASAPAPSWPGLVPEADFYTAVFEPQRAWASVRATHRWSLQVRDTATTYAPGDTLTGSCVLHGPWSGWEGELFAEAFAAGIAGGLGAERVPATVTAWVVEPVQLADEPAPQVCRLHLDSPASLKEGGDECTALSAIVVARSVLRRLQALHLQSVGLPWLDLEPYRQVSALCAALTTSASSQAGTTQRWSNRQRMRVVMPSISGSLDIGGPGLPACWPWLRWAPVLNVGRRAQMGMGVCTLTAISTSMNQSA